MGSTSKSSRKDRKFKLSREARQRIDNEFSEVEEGCSNYEKPQPPKRKHRLLKKLVIRLTVLGLAVIAVNLAVLFFTGSIWFNEPRKRDFPVRGPVITQKQGKVDWKRFASQNLQMVYIRATKGTVFVDERLSENKRDSKNCGVPCGFLHIMELKIDGREQAEHFIKTVGKQSGRLIPAVEVGLSGFYHVFSPDYDKLKNELFKFCERIREEYGCYPVIKIGAKMYDKLDYKSEFSHCPLWIESEYSKPDEGIDYTFWGYSSRVKYRYYHEAGFLEMAVYSSDEADLEKNMMV